MTSSPSTPPPRACARITALRHTFCTILAERGVALEVIRALAGHVDVRTTQIYLDLAGRGRIAALAVSAE